MLWLYIIISAYLILAVNSLVDNYLLLGPPNPKSYAFYTGTLGIITLVLIPFVGFSVPGISQILISLLAGITFVLAIYFLYIGLEYFEPSRIVAAIGGLTPLFTFILISICSRRLIFSGIKEILAFFLLVVGSFLITFERKRKVSLRSFKISLIAAFLFALMFVLTKNVYLNQSFWHGFMWIRIGAFLTGICFLFVKQVRQEIFNKKSTFTRKTGTIFILNQGAGAGALVLQNYAIYLAGINYLPFINALQGVQYVFLFILIFFLTKRFPKISEERFTKKIIIQKTISIALICLGLIIFYF
jgi:drug/metabolite transporter (DMT)-like permease